jgi:RNA polymerase sigma-70 factor (ECF subfamily)
VSTTQEPARDAAVTGDRDAFAAATARYRRELEVHCYRMVGSRDDAEDLVQETLLRAWRRRDTFRGSASLRAWLYGIATNACLDVLQRRRRRVLPQMAVPPADPLAPPPPPSETGWLEPYPDRLLDEVATDEAGPHEVVVERETIELAFLVAIQHLPPRQRAVLILRDVLGWSARETAEVIDASVVAANSALQRARETLAVHLPPDPLRWRRAAGTDAAERELLAQYVDAWSRGDVEGLVALLAEDARFAMPPTPAWYEGRAAIAAFLAGHALAPCGPAVGSVRVATAANRQPAFAVFLADPAGGPPKPFGLEVLRIENGLIAEIDVFLDPQLPRRFAAVEV